MLLLRLRWTKAPEPRIRGVAARLIAEQRTDGGWAGNPNLESDAFATGQVLYALRESGSMAVSDAVHQRGPRYLIERQFPDGSWYVSSRAVKLQPYFQSGVPFDHDQWISAAATGWAATAMAAAMESGERSKFKRQRMPARQEVSHSVEVLLLVTSR